MWSFGVSFYYMITGQLPFSNFNLIQEYIMRKILKIDKISKRNFDNLRKILVLKNQLKNIIINFHKTKIKMTFKIFSIKCLI
jgi:serine/threonine protein kinase